MTMQPLLPGIETTRKTAASIFTAAKQLWSRSVDRHCLMYTGMLGDGDSKSHKAVVDMQPYGPDVEIVKECLNHAHKRMGTALLKLAKDQKLGGRGEGRLTKEKALRMQQYYRYALNVGAGNVDDMRNRVWATLFHSVSTDDAQVARSLGASNSVPLQMTRILHHMRIT